jgi:hypothetical protein
MKLTKKSRPTSVPLRDLLIVPSSWLSLWCKSSIDLSGLHVHWWSVASWGTCSLIFNNWRNQLILVEQLTIWLIGSRGSYDVPEISEISSASAESRGMLRQTLETALNLADATRRRWRQSGVHVGCSPSTWSLGLCMSHARSLPEKFVLPRKITTTTDINHANRFLFRVFILTDFNYIDSPTIVGV